MTRYHLLFRGRIIRSVDAPDGDAAELAFGPDATPATMIFSDADWRAGQWRRALRGYPEAAAQSPNDHGLPVAPLRTPLTMPRVGIAPPPARA